MNDREILCHFMSLLIAYGDTILHLSSFTMLMLAMHLDIQEKVRSEVVKVVGTEGNIFEDKIGQLIYTEMVLKETIRLFPTGALLTRDASDDFEIDGFLVPKGATIAMIPPLTHRLKSHWDEPDKFIPERFSTRNSKNRHPYLYIPFSGGSRSCAGSKYGMACLKVIVAHVIRKYQLMTNMKFEGLKLRTHISIHSRDGYKISIKEIERS
nr:cytochrome P450 4AV17 [Meteorus pulchricornis]